MTDRTHQDSGRATGHTNIIRYALELGLLWIDGDGRDKVREALDALDTLEAQLEAIGAGGVSGPLLGHPQAMPDLSQLTERGAKAWAGVDAQRLRDGGASPSANAGEPSGHIKEPYTLAEIKAKIASNDYSAEMLLQHAMLLLDSASLSASAGSEPVAWRYVDARGHFRYVGYKPSRDMAAEYPLLKPIRLYLHPSSPEGMVGGWTKPHRTITYTCPVCVASLERQK